MPDDTEIFSFLQPQAVERRQWERGGTLRHVAIARRGVGGIVVDNPCLRPAGVGGHAPAFRRGTQQHGASGRAGLSQWQVIQRCRRTSTGELLAERGRIQRRLLDPHRRPWHIEFIGNQHRQHRLDALPDLRVF